MAKQLRKEKGGYLMKAMSIELSGSPREIGEQHGAAYKDEIKKYYDFYCIQHNKRPDKLDKSILDYLKKHGNYLLEEMEGIAKGAGMKFEEILVYNHFNVVTGCTPIFFRKTEVGPLLAQNLDCGKEEHEATLIRVIKPKEGHSFIGASFVGTVWAGNAINDNGVCLAGVSAHQKGYATENGTSGGIIQRDMIQRAGNVDEAFEIAKSHTYIGKIGIFIIADGSEKAVKTEMNNEKHFAFPVKDVFAFTTGLYESEIEAQDEPDYLEVKEQRRKTIQGLYDKGKIEFSLKGMKNLLSHHCSPGSVCRHKPWQTRGENTQSSRIMLINQTKLLITDGPPCKNEYLEYKL